MSQETNPQKDEKEHPNPSPVGGFDEDKQCDFCYSLDIIKVGCKKICNKCGHSGGCE